MIETKIGLMVTFSSQKLNGKNEKRYSANEITSKLYRALTDGVFDVSLLDEPNVSIHVRDITQTQSRVATRVRYAFHVRHP